VSRLLDVPGNGMTYADAGVSIEAGDEAVERIKKVVASTARPEVLGGIGGFGGLFALDTAKFVSPVLVASADGVGTKLEVARQVGRYDSVGIDLVAMLVDDLATTFLIRSTASPVSEPSRCSCSTTWRWAPSTRPVSRNWSGASPKAVARPVPLCWVARPPSTVPS
jgi:hypothetical protein